MPNPLLINVGNIVSWKNTGGDEELDLGTTLGDAGSVGVGSYHDWGVDPRSGHYMWWMDIDGFATDPVVGESVDLYITQSEDFTLWDGPEAPNDTTDSTGAVARLPNLLYLKSAIVTTTTAGDNLSVSGIAFIPARYFAPVVHNNTADDLLIVADAHEVRFYPIPFEM